MYVLRNKKENIKSYCFNTGKLAYINDTGLIVNGELVVPGASDLFTIHKGEVFYVMNNSTYYQSKEINKSILVDSLYENYAIFSSNLNVNNFTLRYQLINLDDQKIKFDFGQQPIIRSIENNGEILFIHFDNRLLALTTKDSKILWERTGKHNRILGASGNQLIVAESNHNILSIDYLNGNIMHEWNKLPGFHAGTNYKSEIPDSTNFKIDSKNTKLIGVFDTYYFEIDLENKNIEYYQLEEEFAKYGISDFRSFFKNPDTSNHFFLTTHTYLDEFPNVDLSSIIALNKGTREIDWLYTFTESGIGTNTPVLSLKHLYQQDTEKNLYIFERS